MLPPRRLRCFALLALALTACGPRLTGFDAEPATPDIEPIDAADDSNVEPPIDPDVTSRCYSTGVYCNAHSACCSRFCDYTRHRCR